MCRRNNNNTSGSDGNVPEPTYRYLLRRADPALHGFIDLENAKILSRLTTFSFPLAEEPEEKQKQAAMQKLEFQQPPSNMKDDDNNRMGGEASPKLAKP